MKIASIITALVLAMGASAQTVEGYILTPESNAILATPDEGIQLNLRSNGKFKAKGIKGQALTLVIMAPECGTKEVTIPATIMQRKRIRLDIVMHAGGRNIDARIAEDEYGLLYIVPTAATPYHGKTLSQ